MKGFWERGIGRGDARLVKVPVKARPAARMFWPDGICILSVNLRVWNREETKGTFIRRSTMQSCLRRL